MTRDELVIHLLLRGFKQTAADVTSIYYLLTPPNKNYTCISICLREKEIAIRDSDGVCYYRGIEKALRIIDAKIRKANGDPKNT